MGINHLYAVTVACALRQTRSCRYTFEHTQARNRTPAVSVRSALVSGETCKRTVELAQMVCFSKRGNYMLAVSAADALIREEVTCKYTFKRTQERNHINAVSAAGALAVAAACRFTFERIQKRFNIHAISAARALVIGKASKYNTLTRMRNHLNAVIAARA